MHKKMAIKRRPR